MDSKSYHGFRFIRQQISLKSQNQSATFALFFENFASYINILLQEHIFSRYHKQIQQKKVINTNPSFIISTTAWKATASAKWTDILPPLTITSEHPPSSTTSRRLESLRSITLPITFTASANGVRGFRPSHRAKHGTAQRINNRGLSIAKPPDTNQPNKNRPQGRESVAIVITGCF